MSKKLYGLIIPSEKKTLTFEAKKNVFGSESDEDLEASVPKKRPMLDTNESTKRQVKVMQRNAMEEDPTVFQYDELYEDMQLKKNEAKSVTKKDRAPKYIEDLMISASKRKREQERRMERKIQKEREEEGEEFADKESFVTSSYKKKLEEMKKEEELEKREAYLEEIGDVTKQKDLGGFYRHLYEQKLSEKPKKEPSSSPKKSSSDNTPTSSPIHKSHNENKKSLNKNIKKRSYRNKIANDDIDSDLSEGEVLSESEDREVNRTILKKLNEKSKSSNIDADSDFSMDSDSEEEKQTKEKEVKEEISKEIKERNVDEIPEETSLKAVSEPSVDDTRENGSLTPPLPKIDIWAKRTVGVKFEEALTRYYERKNARMGGGI